MKTPSQLLAAFAFVFALAGIARAAAIDGKWKSEFESQVGPQKLFLDLKADGEKLTGKATADRGQLGKSEVELKNGKFAKGEVAFTEMLKIQDQEIAIQYTGKLVGDELKLHRKVGDFAEYDIVAKRVKP